nr:glycosyltransferase family 4 protein [Dyella sedimenti]
MGGGGAERVLSALANAWASDHAVITVITLGNRERDVYALHPDIARVDLDLVRPSSGALGAVLRNVERIRKLRAAVKACRPDVVISFMTTTNLLTLLATRGLGLPVIVSERTFLKRQPPRGMWRLLFRPLYRRASAVVSQTRRGAEDLQAQLDRSVAVIHNPVAPIGGDDDSSRNIADSVQLPRERGEQWLLAVGRLSIEKGYDLLIDAFSQLASSHPLWNLIILGEGPERSSLSAQISKLGLQQRVLMPGFVENPYRLMKQADMYVLSSRYEGMPNALLEAMATGLPSVSFDCETGPAELIQDGVNGRLVESGSVSALAASLGELMVSPELRGLLAHRASRIREEHAIDLILQSWKSLALKALARHGAYGSEPSGVGEH